MVQESTQDILERNNPPRVSIKYEVFTDGAIKMKELPFVLGVLADLSGNPEVPLARFKERKFVNIDKVNFDNVFAGTNPRLVYRVDNKLANDGTQIGVELNLKSFSDFEPEQVVKQLDPLRQLLDARNKLSDLRNKMVSNEKLKEIMQEILKSTGKLQALGKEIGHVTTDDTKSRDE